MLGVHRNVALGIFNGSLCCIIMNLWQMSVGNNLIHVKNVKVHKFGIKNVQISFKIHRHTLSYWQFGAHQKHGIIMEHCVSFGNNMPVISVSEVGPM